nr:diguanylate cyclase [Mesorhizobium soli]
MALDLGRFKQVNDTLGHEAGDQSLCEVGRRLAPLIGEADTVARVGATNSPSPCGVSEPPTRVNAGHHDRY